MDLRLKGIISLASVFFLLFLAHAEASRVVVYYQTIYRNEMNFSGYVDPKPLAGYASHLILSSFHVNNLGFSKGVVTLNDIPYDDPKTSGLWNDLEEMKKKGVKIFGMMGGQAAGSWEKLSGTSFNTYYPYLKEMIQKTKIQGLDLDIEQPMQLSDVVHLIQQLKADFGSNFTITLAPVANALRTTSGGLSGFSYFDLEKQQGDNIGFYNTQFYDGWGPLSAHNYEAIVQAGFPASKLVAGSSGNSNGASQYVDVEKVLLAPGGVIATLRSKYGSSFGGIACWEYFNAQPGGTAAPWKWAQLMNAALSS